jgi:hypothetical protein
MFIRFVVLGDRIWFRLFPVFALHRRPTWTRWLHPWRAWLSGVWRHCAVHRISQPDRCEGTPQFWMRLHAPRLIPPVTTFRGTDMARDNTLHQDISHAHTVAYLSASSHSRVTADGLPAIAFTHAVPTYCTAACTPSEVSAREAGTPARTRGRVLSQRRAYCWWAHRHLGAVAPWWA